MPMYNRAFSAKAFYRNKQHYYGMLSNLLSNKYYIYTLLFVEKIYIQCLITKIYCTNEKTLLIYILNTEIYMLRDASEHGDIVLYDNNYNY